MALKKMKTVFMGTPAFAKVVLEGLCEVVDVVLVVSQPDAPVGRKKIMTPSEVKSFALEKGIEVFTPEKIKTDYARIFEIEPDIIITCAYGQIIPKAILDYPKYKAINVHASILPKYRGGAPIQRAIMNGEKETGITIMYMDEHMDSGNIISQKAIPIERKDTWGSLSTKLSELGRDLLIETLPSIFDGTNRSIPQNSDEITFGYIIKRDDEKIDFTKTAEEIYNQIRALSPSPGAFFTLNGTIFKVYEAKIENKTGQINRINNIYNDGIGIGTTDGEIVITKIKPEGKKTIAVRDYLNGIKKENILGVMCNEE